VRGGTGQGSRGDAGTGDCFGLFLTLEIWIQEREKLGRRGVEETKGWVEGPNGGGERKRILCGENED